MTKFIENNSPKRISWVSVMNAIVQAIIAALTALGVSSCANLLGDCITCGTIIYMTDQ